MKKPPKLYEHHPIANIFPMMDRADMQELTKDIIKNGLRIPIVLYEGMILDGRHRYKACDLAEVKPRFEAYRGDDPLGYVLSANLRRRHLDTSQRAIVAANIASYKHGEAGLAVINTKKSSKTPMNDQDANLHLGENGANPTISEAVTREEAAEVLNVSPRSVATAAKLIEEDPRLAKKVGAGEISLNAAVKQLAEKQAEDEPVIDKTGWKVPKELQPLWARRGEVREDLALVTNLKNRLLERQTSNDPLFDNLNFSNIVERLSYVHMLMRKAELYAVCTTCQGRARKDCNHCRGRGFLAKFQWDAVPAEIKAIRLKGSAPVQEEVEA